jgi:hypothetical protein
VLAQGPSNGPAADRVERQAAEDAKFRRLVTGVWRHGMSEAVWARARAIQRTVADPLPEMRPLDD